MSDISFKQVRDIVDRFELAELSLKAMLDKVESANEHFEANLEKQKLVLEAIPISDKKIIFLKILIALNMGFIIGVIVGKYLL
jgi:mRNA-degrading endonuclease HigB of HigAB toxin-antitoxin module